MGEGHVLRPSLRSIVLLVGIAALLVTIQSLLREGASLEDVVDGAGRHLGPVLLVALGLTGIICCGAIDLSVGALIAVASAVFGVLVARSAPPWLCFVACFLTPLVLSLLNGLFVNLLRVPAIIVTLAGLTFYRGVALIIADVGIEGFGGSITVSEDAYHAPGLEWADTILVVTVLGALLFWSLGKTPRTWLALGDSPEACRLQGLSPGRILLGAFGSSGLLVGVAALVQVTQLQNIEPARMALGFELQAIGAVVLGGTNIFGGEGSYLGTILGALFLYLLEQALGYAGVSPYLRDVLSGGTILIVIGVDCYLVKQRKRVEEL